MVRNNTEKDVGTEGGRILPLARHSAASLTGRLAWPGPGWGEELPEHWGRLGTDAVIQPIATEPGNYPAFYRLLERALRQGGAPPVPPGDAVDTLEVIEAAQKSSSQHAIITLKA